MELNDLRGNIYWGCLLIVGARLIVNERLHYVLLIQPLLFDVIVELEKLLLRLHLAPPAEGLWVTVALV